MYVSTFKGDINRYRDIPIVIYEPSAGRRCSRMSAFFKARATKERVPLIKARMNGRCLHASGSYNIFCTKIKLIFFVLIH
jgi:ferric-dicitrate binding protein FerR (iron transport regulator)